ncbi:MAG TPA: galactokinase [Anaerolineales bacterium]|nr:galactokinase [Anaerolineales bacterium]
MGVGLADFSARRILITSEFESRFGAFPSVWVRAPGRVDLMGSHTDYNEGFVLTMSIDRDTWIAARPKADRVATIYSLDAAGGGSFNLDDIQSDAVSPWTNYVRGVAKVFQDEGYALQGFDGLIQSTIPLGSGVSSSAALEVATAVLLRALGGWDIDPLKLALLGQRAENEFVGVRCGILDQYSSALGRAGHTLLLDCRQLTSEARPLAKGLAIVVGDTRARRQLTASSYEERRAECEEGAGRLAELNSGVSALRDVSLDQLLAHRDALPEVILRRCRFVIEEDARVREMAAALESGERESIRRAARESYVGARDLFEIVSPEMENMIEAMNRSPGVIGARQAGAGFGGCMVAVVEADQVEPFLEHVKREYSSATGLEPMVYPVYPAEGAGLLEG